MKNIDFLQNLDRNLWTKFARDSYLEGFFHDNPFRPLDILITPLPDKLKVRYSERTGEKRAWAELYFDAFSAKYIGDYQESLNTRSSQVRYNQMLTQQWRAFMYKILANRDEELARQYYRKLMLTAKNRKFNSEKERENYIKQINEAIDLAKTKNRI